MPRMERLVFDPKPIGASARQPRHIFDNFERQTQAIGHEGFAITIIHAFGAASIEQFARDIGFGDRAAVSIFDFVQAAAPAAIA